METLVPKLPEKRQSFYRYFRSNGDLYVMMVPALIYLFVYKFTPLFGLSIAFKDFNMFISDNIFSSVLQSPWVGLKHFERFFSSPDFMHVLSNTLLISCYKIVFLFPLPIVLAILLNELRNVLLKRTIQTLIYMPHFLSWVVVFGIFYMVLGNDGLLNNFIAGAGGSKISFFMDKSIFRALLVVSDGWKESGWNTVVYLAAITSINIELYEAATMDGANRFEKMRYITLPGIYPVIALMLILRVGKILEAGFEQVLVMYNPAVYEVADIIQTYIYRMGIGQMDYSLGTAVGLFDSAVAFILVVSSNAICKKLLGKSIW